MTRGLTTTEINAATAASTIVAQLVHVAFDSGPLRLCVGGIDITDGNGITWYAAGKILQLAEARESASATEGFSFQMSGLDPAIVTIAASEPYRGRVITIYEAWLNEAWQLIAPPRAEWVGRLTALTIDETDGKCVVQGSAEHYEADLRRPRAVRYTAADQRRRYPDDAGCDHLESLADARVIWPTRELQMRPVK